MAKRDTAGKPNRQHKRRPLSAVDRKILAQHQRQLCIWRYSIEANADGRLADGVGLGPVEDHLPQRPLPFDPDDTDEAHARNRRSHFVITGR